LTFLFNLRLEENVAKTMWCVCATSVPCGRHFSSSARYVVNRKWSAISRENVNILVCLQDWTKTAEWMRGAVCRPLEQYCATIGRAKRCSAGVGRSQLPSHWRLQSRV